MPNFEPSKPFLDYPEMVELLRSRNLTIAEDDISFAIHSLQTYSYYGLVNGNIGKLLIPHTEDQFQDNISIRLLVRIKIIEEQIRSLFLSQILAIEKTFCTKVSWYVAREFGVDSGNHGYLKKSNYSSSQPALVRSTMKRLKSVLSSSIPNRKASTSLSFYREKHNHVPPWILVNDLMFGEVINWYRCLGVEGKNEVSAGLFIFSIEDRNLRSSLLIQTLDLLREYRNFFAHNSALSKMKSNRKLNSSDLFRVLSSTGVINENEFDGDNSNNLYACFISILLLSTSMDQLQFFLLSFEQVYNTLDLEEQKIIFKNTFGFPDNFFALAKEVVAKRMNEQ